jgi:hypothetical protein
MSSARRAALGLAAVKLAIHVAFLTPYGWFRDELYYVACSKHLAFGYVDQPPLSIALLRVWRAVFGDSLAAMRLAPALAGAATVYLAGTIAIELGGGVLAVMLAGLCLLSAPLLLGSNHLYSMNSFDVLLWTLAALVLVRALRREQLRDWVLLGVVLGLGLLNKISVLWLGAGLAVALVATPARRHLGRPGPWIATAIALALFAPHLVWQVQNGFPTLEFMHNAMTQKYVRDSPLAFVLQAVMLMNPIALLVWLPGVVRGGVLGLTFLAVGLLLALARTKAEYLAPAFPMVLAAGGVAWQRLLHGKRYQWIVAGALAIAILGFGAVAAPFALPVLSEEGFVAYESALGQKPKSAEKKELNDLPQHYADMHGWPELAALVDDAVATLSPDERRGAVTWIWGNYGEAAAIERFAHDPPHVACGHNNYWLWGPGHGDGRAVVVVGGRRERIAPLFRELVQTGTFECRPCMPYENHKAIWVGRGLVRPLSDLWPEEKSYE